MGLFSSSKSSTSNQSNTTNTYDQRQVNDASGGGLMLGAAAKLTSTQNTAINDASNGGLVLGGSARIANTTTTTINSVDPGIAKTMATLAGQNTAALHALSDQQGDTMKVIAGLGATGIKTMGDSATKIFSQAESNSATAWGHTVDASEKALDRMFSAASGVLSTSNGLAQAAIAAYQPADNKASDNTVKVVGYLAAAAVVAFLLTRKG